MRRNTGLSFYRKRKKISSTMVREIFTWFFGIFTAIILAFFVVISFGMQVSVIGVSMEKELFNEQTIYVNQLIYNFTSPKRGDVIVFLPNGNEKSHHYIKRVVGLPGESVQIKNGRLFIDDVQIEEEYDKMSDPGIAADVIYLDENEYFVLGDNRNSSEDSRYGNIGSVNKDVIAGKAWFHLSSDTVGMGLIE